MGGNNGDGKMPEMNTVKAGGEKEIVEKIQAANSILILMKKKPSVDEMAAAIGMEMILDGMGKRATILYSGEIPGEIRFLEPEKSFAKNTEVLQDFVVSFKQVMADHLRYDVVGDEVKIFISPYRKKITENDLSFSYGEAVVDLVVELNIQKVAELSREGIEQILNKAETVQIATGEVERTKGSVWVNKAASSVAEMVAGMMEKMPEAKIRKEAANAFLAGIVVMTEKFMNQKTTPETMGVAQKLMQVGANPAEIMAEIEKGKKMGALETESGVVSGTEDGGGVNSGVASGVANALNEEAKVEKIEKMEVEKKVDGANGEKKVKIPEEEIKELDKLAEKMNTEKAENLAREKIDEMMKPKEEPVVEHRVEDVLGEGAAKSAEKIRNTGIYPGADLDDYVEVQPQAWRTKDYEAMMDKELEENPAAVAAAEVGSATGNGLGADVPVMDYTATAGVEDAPGFDAEMVSGVAGAENVGEVSAAAEGQVEPMRKIERPKAVEQTMTEAELKQPWEIGANPGVADFSVGSGDSG
ncbi:MAG: hypothetical protein Q4F60_02835, partial [Candidatus Saccharibacteria bacterium]|nr:hypothetical protein [Candidatus Saccharibacteria bacterium]